jgi:cytochrome c-type biogenesis protein CcmH/NrfF
MSADLDPRPAPLPTARPDASERTTRRAFTARALALLGAGLVGGASLLASPPAQGQDIGLGMDRTGTVGIQNETERLLFWSLLCTCGCPRETLGTCTCGFAHERRGELRNQLAMGKTIEQIQAWYVGRFGTQALAVPPDSGGSRALYVAPLLAIVAGAALIITTLKRWRARGEAAAAEQTKAAPPTKPNEKDDYDAKLDDELRNLDE